MVRTLNEIEAPGRTAEVLPSSLASTLTTMSGTHLECQYYLMSFGLPDRFLPVSQAGDIDLEPHLDWLKRRRLQEQGRTEEQPSISVEREEADAGDVPQDRGSREACNNELPSVGFSTSCSVAEPMGTKVPTTLTSSLEVERKEKTRQAKGDPATAAMNHTKPVGQKLKRIMVPGPNDVLMGRGKVVLQHRGNLKYRQIVEDYSDRIEIPANLRRQLWQSSLFE